jgi:hypothetical protein
MKTVHRFARHILRLLDGSLAKPLMLSVTTFLLAIGSTNAQVPITLQSKEVKESSGVAFSQRVDGLFWTHNDSGDKPVLYAFHLDGSHAGSVAIKGSQAVDWEDIESFELDGFPWLMIADTGDNLRRRRGVVVYALKEPETTRNLITVDRTWNIEYPTGPLDCEGLAFDVHDRQILLVEKNALPHAQVFAVPWENRSEEGKPLKAVCLGSISVPMVTAATYSPKLHALIVMTYTDAFVYVREHDTKLNAPEPWETTLARSPKILRLPRRPQGEAIGITKDGDHMIVTSEGSPAQAWRTSVKAESLQP